MPESMANPQPRLFTLRRKGALRAANITHVLSVLNFDIEEDLLKDYKKLKVEVDDVEDENLLEHFKATNAFIEEGLSAGGGVYVHW
jgi:dual specificity phosphatase 12